MLAGSLNALTEVVVKVPRPRWAGAQKLVFNPATSKSAGRLGITKRAYQRIGLCEIAGALGLLVGMVAKGNAPLAIINEVAAGGLVVLMTLAVAWHLRSRDPIKFVAPAALLGVFALIELVFRLIG